MDSIYKWIIGTDKQYNVHEPPYVVNENLFIRKKTIIYLTLQDCRIPTSGNGIMEMIFSAQNIVCI